MVSYEAINFLINSNFAYVTRKTTWKADWRSVFFPISTPFYTSHLTYVSSVFLDKKTPLMSCRNGRSSLYHTARDLVCFARLAHCAVVCRCDDTQQPGVWLLRGRARGGGQGDCFYRLLRLNSELRTADLPLPLRVPGRLRSVQYDLSPHKLVWK